MLGLVVGTFALIVILSTFNGFENVVSKLFSTFNSDVKVVPVSGKYFIPTANQMASLKAIPYMKSWTPVIEELVMIDYKDQQNIATFKAIEPSFLPSTGIDTMILGGQSSVLNDGKNNFSLVGAGVANRLNMIGDDYERNMQLYFIKNKRLTAGDRINPLRAVTSRTIHPGGVFSVLEDIDDKYILLPLSFARELTNMPKQITGIEFNLKDEKFLADAKRDIQNIMGIRYKVQDRFEQQPLLYKVMRTEKMAVYLILAFVLLIAAFNLVGALVMLAIEKKKDMMVLISMGAPMEQVRKIIMNVGLMLCLIGAFSGLVLGTVVCYLQQQYGIIKIDPGSTFILDAYPIAFSVWDFVLVIATVLIIGYFAAWFPARTAYKHITIEDLREG